MILKRLFKILLILVIVSLGTSPALAASKVIRVQSHNGPQWDHLADEMKKSVKEQSNGTLSIAFFHGGELAESTNILGSVARGVVDIADTVPAYYTGEIRVAKVESGIPGAWFSNEEDKDVLKKMHPLLEKAYSEHGVELLGHAVGSNYGLLSIKPVKSLKDLKGMKIRATGLMSDLLAKFGANTTFIPEEDIYTSLSTGLISGLIFGGPYDHKLLHFDSVAKYYTMLRAMHPGWNDVIIGNPKTLKGLTEKEREIVTSAVVKYADDVNRVLDKENAEMINNKELFTYFDLSDSDREKMYEASLSLWDDVGKRSERSKKAIEILRDNAKEHGRIK